MRSIMTKVQKITKYNIRQTAESYRTTVNVLLCFLSLTTWERKKKNENFSYSLGRKMCTSKENKISPNNDVTPDLVIQVEKNEAYICEVKSSLPINNALWNKYIAQLQKYDDVLTGWWSEDGKIESNDVVLLLEITRSKKFTDFANELEKNNGPLFTNTTVFIEYIRATNTEETIFFRTQRGRLSNSKLDSTLSAGTKVPIEKVLFSYGRLKFCDQQPEPEYLMEVLWQHVFNSMKINMPFDAIKKAWVIDVNVPQLTALTQKSYGNLASEVRERCFPQISWIRGAMEHFVAMKYAVKVSNDNYQVFYKVIRTELLEKFFSSRKLLKDIEVKKKQFDLKFIPKKSA
jgi:hypothetical protein